MGEQSLKSIPAGGTQFGGLVNSEGRLPTLTLKPEATLQEVQDRGMSGPTKRTFVLNFFQKMRCDTHNATSDSFSSGAAFTGARSKPRDAGARYKKVNKTRRTVRI